MRLKGFARLADRFVPKQLEQPYLLDKPNDDLYELTADAFAFILRCDGTARLDTLAADSRFARQLVRKGMLELTDTPLPRTFLTDAAALPSLRYLEVQLTERCNLDCRHCYQGKKGSAELSWDLLRPVLEEFAAIQGLRVLFSGGEPLLYSRFAELNEYIAGYPVHTVLLTNGTLVAGCDVRTWRFDEIQFSLDGMETGHDAVRGPGSFRRLCDGIEKIRAETPIAVSFATIVHTANVGEFRAMKKLVKAYRGKEWGIDMPVVEGSFRTNVGLFAKADDVIRAMRHRFGASYHATGDDTEYACGAHLMTLTAGGDFLPCGFYPERLFGRIGDGLRHAVENRRLTRLADISACRDCAALLDCRGGCRFRAVGGRDEIMCRVFGR